MPTPSSAFIARLSGDTYSMSYSPPASINAGGKGGIRPCESRTSNSRSISGPSISVCCRPMVGANKAPFSCARCNTSVAVIVGVSTKIWNKVTRKESFITFRRCSIISKPMSTRAPVCRGWIGGCVRPSIRANVTAPGFELIGNITPSSATNKGGSTTFCPARITVFDISLIILISGKTVIAGDRP